MKIAKDYVGGKKEKVKSREAYLEEVAWTNKDEGIYTNIKEATKGKILVRI